MKELQMEKAAGVVVESPASKAKSPLTPTAPCPCRSGQATTGHVPVKEGMFFLLIRGESCPEIPLFLDFWDF